MKLRFRHSVMLAAMLFGAGCPEESTPAVADGGSPDAGAPDAGAPAPADVTFALGLSNSTRGGPPQSAPLLKLKFRGGTPSADTVVAQRVTTAPTLDGEAADWASIPGSTVAMQKPGLAIGMSDADYQAEYGKINVTPKLDHGIANATVKTAYDNQNIYLLVQWDDATEDRKREEWAFTDPGDGGTPAWKRSATLNEDSLHLAFNIGGSFGDFEIAGCSAACHVKANLVLADGGVDRAAKFSMHTGGPTEKADVWSWRATRSAPLGLADDQYWDATSRKPDGTPDLFVINRYQDAGIDQPSFMAAAGVNANVDYIFKDADAGSPLAVAFDGTGAVVGSRIPGFVHQTPAAEKSQIRAIGKYASGKWTVEIKRALTTTETNDVQFPIQ